MEKIVKMDEFNKNNFEELSISDNICINGGGFISIIVAIGITFGGSVK